MIASEDHCCYPDALFTPGTRQVIFISNRPGARNACLTEWDAEL